MGAYSNWEAEYDREAYYKEKVKEDVRQWEMERLREVEECNPKNPCGHCADCCQDVQGYDPNS